MNADALTRREWLTRGAGAIAVAGAAVVAARALYDPLGGDGYESAPAASTPRNYFESIDFPASNPRISIATGPDDQIERMVRAAIGGLDPRAGMSRFIRTGDVVFLKPNVGFDRPPYLGATTHPEIVRGLIRLCRGAGAQRVLVADHPIEAPAACFARSGIQRVADEEGAVILPAAPGNFETVAVRAHRPDAHRGEVLGSWPLFIRPLTEATKVIGVAPIKDHNLAGGSMNLKNWYGLLGGTRNRLHQAIHATISDLALLISPTLVIGDATRVMMSNGPTGGRISDLRPGGELGRSAVIASVDPVACDAWCYEKLLGRDPSALRYLALAQAKIGAQIATGVKRFGERDWRIYERQGQVVFTSVV